MPLLIAAGISAVGGGLQAYQGWKQAKAGREAENQLVKPEFEIPTEIVKNMSLAEKRAYQGLTDEQKRQFLENQQRTSQAALRSSSDRRGGLGMISQIQAQENLSNRQLLQADMSAQEANIQKAMEARSVMAAYKDKRFEHQYNEYVSDLDYARAQIGAGKQNIAGGLNTIASSAMTVAGAGGFGNLGGAGAQGAAQAKQGGGLLGMQSPMAKRAINNPLLSSEGTQSSLIQDMTNTQKKNLFGGASGDWSQFGTDNIQGTYMPGVGVGTSLFGGSNYTITE